MFRARGHQFLVLLVALTEFAFSGGSVRAEAPIEHPNDSVITQTNEPTEFYPPLPARSDYHIGGHLPRLTGTTSLHSTSVQHEHEWIERPFPPNDSYAEIASSPASRHCWNCSSEWQVLPEGILYKSYLAGPKEPRFGTSWLHEENRGWIWETTLGGRVGLLRYGPADGRLEGFQLDLEGAAFPRLDIPNERDVEAVDFRVGIPLTWAKGPYQFKFAYYHLSSHLGDEFLERFPAFTINRYSRDAFVLGMGYFVTPDVRLYGETGWAFFNSGPSRVWEFQFGGEYSPAQPTGKHGVPFLAINGHLREDVDFGGGLNVMTGLQWRGTPGGHLFRVGLQYYNGKSMQYALFNRFEELLGLGVWYDF